MGCLGGIDGIVRRADIYVIAQKAVAEMKLAKMAITNPRATLQIRNYGHIHPDDLVVITIVDQLGSTKNPCGLTEGGTSLTTTN